jgi:cell division protein ZapA (FtsZ GTPase activity inhibitor)
MAMLPQQRQNALMIEYLDHLRSQETVLSEEYSLVSAALYSAHERLREIQRGENMRAMSRSSGRPETRDEAIRESAQVLQRLEDEKAWIETLADDLEVHMSIWQSLLSEKSPS